MFAYGTELIAAKRAQPGDDMLSVVANATVEDAECPSLSDIELYMFFSLLFSAGAETTRNGSRADCWRSPRTRISIGGCRTIRNCCPRRSRR